ncbi:hypothetical protein JXB12_11290 [candidate division KSB1 bacterium]|nr:hypothetical protein [candidate division KSB1 bacterium]
MSVEIVEKIGDVIIYGNGSPGGKGSGLVKINQCKPLRSSKLKTRVLSTTFYDRFLTNRGRFGDEELSIIGKILDSFGSIPVSVRSSATNEAVIGTNGNETVHAGEYASFMLPNNHRDVTKRRNQLIQAIYHIYRDFIEKSDGADDEKMAIVMNPIPGVLDATNAGLIYYPLVSGIANSYFPYALKSQNPNDGFARIAFGHGYATVLDDFPVISVATIKEPIPLKLMENFQVYFYAIDMTRNISLRGQELETMKKLHISFANPSYTQILGTDKRRITFERLIEEDFLGFRTSLMDLMDVIYAKIASHFQIEFVFNVDMCTPEIYRGNFHIVQLTELPMLRLESFEMPNVYNRLYISIENLQGHGIKHQIAKSIVVSPFIYSKKQHDLVRSTIIEMNRQMKETGTHYIIIVPGRLGSKNRDWGIEVDYKDIDMAAAIFEYGVDIAGRSEPVSDTSEDAGGIYGSHFLYMLQGGYDENQKRLRTRMFGTQGTHFLTNIISNNIIYGYIVPNSDMLDPWFFSSYSGDNPSYILDFPEPVSIYADSINQKCMVISQ